MARRVHLSFRWMAVGALSLVGAVSACGPRTSPGKKESTPHDSSVRQKKHVDYQHSDDGEAPSEGNDADTESDVPAPAPSHPSND